MRKIDNEMRNTIYDIRKKLLLKITAIVVIGTFLIGTVFIDFAWACPSKPWRSRTKTDSFLRVPVDEGIREEIKNKLVVNSVPPGSPANFFRILTRDENSGREVSIAELSQETGISADTIERDMRILKEAGLIIREKSEGKITFKVVQKLNSSGIKIVQDILDEEYQWGQIGKKTKKSERDRIIRELKNAVEMGIGRGMYKALMKLELEGRYADYVKDMLRCPHREEFKLLRYEVEELCRDAEAVISLAESINEFVEIIFEDIDKKSWVEYRMREEVRSLVDSMFELDVFNTADKFEEGLKHLEYLAGKIKEKGIDLNIALNICNSTISTFARFITLADIRKISKKTEPITIEWFRSGIESVCKIADKTPESRDRELWYNLIAIVFEVAGISKTVEEFESELQYLDDFVEKIKGMGIEIDNMLLSAIFEVPGISKTVEEFESGLEYLKDFVVGAKKGVYPKGEISEYTVAEIEIFQQEIAGYENTIHLGVRAAAEVSPTIEGFRDGLKHLENFAGRLKERDIGLKDILYYVVPAVTQVSKTTDEFKLGLDYFEDFVVRLKENNLHENFDYEVFATIPNKLKKIGVNFEPILRDLINNKQIVEMELLISLDVTELNAPEYKEIIVPAIKIFKNNIPEQIDLLAKLSKIVNIVKDIPESKEGMLEHFKEWQKNPSVSTFGGRLFQFPGSIQQ